MSNSIEDMIMDELELEERFLVLENLKDEIAERNITKDRRENAFNNHNREVVRAAGKRDIEIAGYIRVLKAEGIHKKTAISDVMESFGIGKTKAYEIWKITE